MQSDHSLPRRTTLAAVLTVLVASLPLAAHAGEVVMVDGVPHVRNGAEPEHGTETWQLEERWRAGGDDDDTVFGRINEAHADGEGNIYLLDEQLAHVYVYSPAGELVRTLSREGEGPGEVRRPIGMVFMPNGNLGILQPYPGKIIQLSLTGEPASTIIIENGSSMVYNADARGDRLVVTGVKVVQEPGFQVRHSFLARIDEEGQIITRYLDHHYRFDFEDFAFIERDMHFPYWLWAMDDDGRIYVAPERNRYAITVMNGDGVVERVIEREFESRLRSDEDLERADERFVNMARNVPFPTRNEVEKTDADFAGMHVAGDGSLWVRTSRGHRDLPDGIMRRFDVFDRDGHFVKHVDLALEGCDSRDWLYVVDDSHVMVRSEAHDDESDAGQSEMICYVMHPPKS